VAIRILSHDVLSCRPRRHFPPSAVVNLTLRQSCRPSSTELSTRGMIPEDGEKAPGYTRQACSKPCGVMAVPFTAWQSTAGIPQIAPCTWVHRTKPVTPQWPAIRTYMDVVASTRGQALPWRKRPTNFGRGLQ